MPVIGVRTVVLVTALAVTAAAACGGSGAPRGDASTPAALACAGDEVLELGQPIPRGCVFERLDGGTLALRDLVGTPLVLNFWASWCTYCVDEMPDFERVHREMGDRVRIVGLDLLGVQGETKALAERFARETGVTYPLAYDEGGRFYDNFAPRQLMPTTALVDAEGVLRFRKFGPMDAADLREALREHLAIS